MNMLNKKNMPSHDDSKVIAFGFSVITIVFFIFGGWMAFANIDSSSVAVGKISADSQKKVVQHLQGGIVKTLYVKEGELVKQGQLLIKLEDIQIKSELDSFKNQYMDTFSNYNRLVAHRDNLKQIKFEDFIVNENMKNDQNSIFNTINKSLNDQKKISEKKIFQLKNQINGIKSFVDTRKKRKVSLDEEAKELEELYAKKLVDKVKIREIYRETNSIDGEISGNRSDIAKLEEQISEIETEQLLTEKEFQNKVLEQIVTAKNNLNELKLKIEALEDTLARTEIKAPIAGNIVGMNMHTEGGVINARENILEIVPENSDLIVLAQVSVNDIDKVKKGLYSDIRFSAFNLKQTTVIQGIVEQVSADRLTDDKGESYYLAKIKVTPEGKEDLKKYNFKLVAGMPAEVMIRIGERTPLSYFISPLTDMFARGFNEE